MRDIRDLIAMISIGLSRLPTWYIALLGGLMGFAFMNTLLTQAAVIEYHNGVIKAVCFALGVGILAAIAARKALRR